MAIQTNIEFEVTDTFGGEPNYAWVKRGTIETKPGEDYSDKAAVRRVKKSIGWTGERTTTESDGGDGLIIRPRRKGIHQVCFVTFHSFGSCAAPVQEKPARKYTAVRQTACRFCGLDIEGFAPYRRGEWRDRGNNSTCDGNRKHAPVKAG